MIKPSVCPSVCLSPACVVTKRTKFCRYCYTIWKIDHPSFLTRRMVAGGRPFYLKFWAKLTHCHHFENADFQPISARSASSVIPSKKFNYDWVSFVWKLPAAKLYHSRLSSLAQMVGGGCPLLPEILDHSPPHWKTAISNLYSLVARQP